MPITLADAVIYVAADDTQANKDLQQTERKTKGFFGRMGISAKQLFGVAIAGGVALATKALIDLGTEVVNLAVDMDRIERSFQTVLGVTEQRAKELTDLVRTLFAQGRFGADEIAAGIEQIFLSLGQSAQALTDEELANMTNAALTLSGVFGIDMTESLEAVSIMMKSGLAANSQEAFDIITAGMQNGLNVNGDLIDTLREYSDDFADLGLTGSEVLTMLNNGLEAGAFNTDKLGDALNEFGIRLRDPAIGKALMDIDIGLWGIYSRFQNGEITEKQALDGMLQRLNDIEDPIARDQAGVQLFGSMWEDLGETAILNLNNIDAKAIEVDGSTQNMVDSTETLGTRWESVKRRFFLAMEPVGEAIVGLAEGAVSYLEESILGWTIVFETWREVSTHVLLQVTKSILNFVNNIPHLITTGKLMVQIAAQKMGDAIYNGIIQPLFKLGAAIANVINKAIPDRINLGKIDLGFPLGTIDLGSINLPANPIPLGGGGPRGSIGGAFGGAAGGGGGPGGTGGFFASFAAGGRMLRGLPTLVGEEGPELATAMNGNTAILPAGLTQALMGGAGANLTLNIYTSAPAETALNDFELMRAMALK